MLGIVLSELAEAHPRSNFIYRFKFNMHAFALSIAMSFSIFHQNPAHFL
jgi:hypothetical protein